MTEDMGEKLLSTLCTNSLALSGFSFTSLAVFLGFYKDTLSQVSAIIQCLMVATIFFFISSEIAREGHTVFDYLLSESIYLLSCILVFYGFAAFVWLNLSYFGQPVFYILVEAGLLFGGKLLYSGWIVANRFLKESRRKRRRS